MKNAGMIAPRLEAAASAYPSAAPKLIEPLQSRRDEAESQQMAVENLLTAAKSLQKALRKALPLLSRAESHGFVAPAKISLANLRKYPMQELRPWQLDQADEYATVIIDQARRWRDSAKSAAERRRGRPRPLRREFASWIGRLFRELDIPISYGRSSVFAKTLALAYELAGIPVPGDLFPDLAWVRGELGLRNRT